MTATATTPATSLRAVEVVLDRFRRNLCSASPVEIRNVVNAHPYAPVSTRESLAEFSRDLRDRSAESEFRMWVCLRLLITEYGLSERRVADEVGVNRVTLRKKTNSPSVVDTCEAVRRGVAVLSRDDSVANKVGALFTRGEARDYIDVYAAATTGGYTCRQLEELGRTHDAGFDLPMFAQALRACSGHDDAAYMMYELSRDEVTNLRSFFAEWADAIDSR